MAQLATPAPQGCIFCAIAAGQAQAHMVHEDADVVAFLDLHPVTAGHLLVVPRQHAAGLEDLDEAVGAHVWSVGRALARALRRSRLGCEGINLLVCDGEAALQTVFHFHLHVIPRYTPGEWALPPDPPQADAALLESHAQAIVDALAASS